MNRRAVRAKQSKIERRLHRVDSAAGEAVLALILPVRPLLVLSGRGGESLAAPRGVPDASGRCKQRPSKFLVGGRYLRRWRGNIQFTAMTPQTKESFQDRAQAAFRFAGTQVRHLITKYPNYFPLFTVRGKWKHESEAWTNWCEGFLGGMLWILFRHSGDTWWREWAEHYSRLIEHRKTDRHVHDLGFLFLPTWKAWYDLTGDPAKNQVVIARQVVPRFPGGQEKE